MLCNIDILFLLYLGHRTRATIEIRGAPPFFSNTTPQFRGLRRISPKKPIWRKIMLLLRIISVDEIPSPGDTTRILMPKINCRFFFPTISGLESIFAKKRYTIYLYRGMLHGFWSPSGKMVAVFSPCKCVCNLGGLHIPGVYICRSVQTSATCDGITIADGGRVWRAVR